ncbi:hypothetical protein HYH02_008355 [Chlamydomonas schloesseri]|uniref:Uncharacterized protein n=1 Tax=Chlamydomonas schloesseri TaxID=2026947 RepID=A0A836B3Q7_9CHLO|nr:hypothetical protein HYH02_008355 [Chlamydomonas schloesseri]|eukprot:KAG2446795.1 hypothetical protein HYH02_008355 [Chlamydomonas schloesseri]
MAPEFATVFSAIIAITSVSINLYGGLITEKRRAELAREVERERQALAAAEEERSVVARYRGPLLEATADLEARIYHIATLSGEWRSGEVVCEEEVVYTLFTLAQWLGFLEVIRREGPRERSFLQRSGATGNASGGGAGGAAGSGAHGGTDTLTTLVEGFRFVLSAHPTTLRKWYEQGDDRDHPGLRSRLLMLRGTPALPSHAMRAAAAGMATAKAGGAPPHLPPAPQTDWAAVSAAAAAAAASGSSSPSANGSSTYGGSSSSTYGGSSSSSGGNGRAEPAGSSQQPQQPRWRGAWVGMASGGVGPGGGPALPPPPTQPVMLLPAGFNNAPGAAGRAPLYGPGTGSELVIGSLDEMSLEEAGFTGDVTTTSSSSAPASSFNSQQQQPLQPQQQLLQPQQSPMPGAAPRYPPPEPTTLTVPPPPSAAGAPPSAGGNALAAAMMFADFGPSLASLSSLSSIDEGSFSGFGGATAFGGLEGLGPAGSPGVGQREGGGYEAAGGGGRLSAPRDVFHMSRGTQRSIGSMMVVTPMGAKRHYTLSYGDFYNRYYLDPVFASWLRPVHTDILALVGGRRWTGQGPFPLNRWTRLLLLQQLLVEAIDLLDPAHVRVPANRRVVLAPVSFREAPELEAYRARMREMSQVESPLQMQQSAAAAAAATPLGRLRTWVQGLSAAQQQQQQVGALASPSSAGAAGAAGGIYTPDLVSTAAAAAALDGPAAQQQATATAVVVVAPGSGAPSNGSSNNGTTGGR